MKKISFNKFWKINEKDFTKGQTKEQIKNLKVLMRNCYNHVGKIPTLEERVHLSLNGFGPIYPKYISKELIKVIPKGENETKSNNS